MKTSTATAYRKVAAVLAGLALLTVAPSSLWEVRTAISLLWVDLPGYRPWAEVLVEDPHPVELHFVGIVLLGLMVVALIAFGCWLVYRGRYVRAVACFIAAGVMAAARYWDYKTLDVRYDFQHLLGHAVYDKCLGNPVPDIEVLGGVTLLCLLCLAVPFGLYGIALGCCSAHSWWRRRRES